MENPEVVMCVGGSLHWRVREARGKTSQIPRRIVRGKSGKDGKDADISWVKLDSVLS